MKTESLSPASLDNLEDAGLTVDFKNKIIALVLEENEALKVDVTYFKAMNFMLERKVKQLEIKLKGVK